MSDSLVGMEETAISQQDQQRGQDQGRTILLPGSSSVRLEWLDKDSGLALMTYEVTEESGFVSAYYNIVVSVLEDSENGIYNNFFEFEEDKPLVLPRGQVRLSLGPRGDGREHRSVFIRLVASDGFVYTTTFGMPDFPE